MKTRSRTGCLTCRKRKKKCDELYPRCGHCQQRQLDCEWPEAVRRRRDIKYAAPSAKPKPNYILERIAMQQDVTDGSEPDAADAVDKETPSNYVISLIAGQLEPATLDLLLVEHLDDVVNPVLLLYSEPKLLLVEELPVDKSADNKDNHYNT